MATDARGIRLNGYGPDALIMCEPHYSESMKAKTQEEGLTSIIVRFHTTVNISFWEANSTYIYTNAQTSVLRGRTCACQHF